MPQFKVSESIDGVSIDAWVTIDPSSRDWSPEELAQITQTHTPNTIAGRSTRNVARASLSDALLQMRSSIRTLSSSEAFEAKERRRVAIEDARRVAIEDARDEGKAEALKVATEALTAKNTELATKDQTILDLNAKVTAAEETDRALKAALAYITELETAAKQEAAAQQQAKDRENERRRNKRAADKARATRPTSKRK